MRIFFLAVLCVVPALANPTAHEPRAPTDGSGLGRPTLSTPSYQPEIKWDMSDALFGKGNYYGVRDKRVKGWPRGVLTETQGSYSEWTRGSMPQFVLNQARQNNWDPMQFQCYGITTSDCAQPWPVCIHDDAVTKIEYYFNTFVRLPRHLRNYVSHVMSVPGRLRSSSVGTTGNIVYGGDISGTMMIFEAGYHLNAFKKWHTSEAWRDAYDADSQVLTAFANSNMVANFGEMILAGTYEVNVNGGLKGLVNTTGIRHQLEFMRANVGYWLANADDPNEKCNRWPNDETVSV